MKNLLMFLVFVSLLGACTGEDQRQPQTLAPVKTDLELLLEQTAQNPKDADAWYHLADLYDRVELYEQEIDALKKVVALQPKRGYAYLRMGNACNRLGRYPEAVQSFGKAKPYQAKNPVLYNNLAFAYGKLGRTKDEIAALRKAIELRPRYATARFNLAVASLRNGDRGEALTQYKALNNIDGTLAAQLKKEIEHTR